MTTYFVTDIEADGPEPARNSMLSFGTVACSIERGIIDQFYAVLKPRNDRISHPEVMTWWKTQPEAYAEATRESRDAEEVTHEFAAWVESFDGNRVFAAAPLSFDGAWIDEYFRTYLSTRLAVGPLSQRRIFSGYGLDLPSYMSGLFGWNPATASQNLGQAPAWMRGNVVHSHKAIDDALGYAHILLNAIQISGKRGALPQDYMRSSK
ncbi:MAG: 3'-5' exoribonuclease [Pseudomonadota bacterium]|nr:3'-5' exoribonuclease [Pseudomonadota bacterium]